MTSSIRTAPVFVLKNDYPQYRAQVHYSNNQASGQFPLSTDIQPMTSQPVQLANEPNLLQQQQVDRTAASVLQLSSPNFIKKNKLYQEAKNMALLAPHAKICNSALRDASEGKCALRESKDGKGLTLCFKIKHDDHFSLKKLALRCEENYPNQLSLGQGHVATSIPELLNKVIYKSILLKNHPHNWEILTFDETKCTGKKLVSDITGT